MKKSTIVFTILSTIIIIFIIVFCICKNSKINSKKIDLDYIESYFLIMLDDAKDENEIHLGATAEYIGNDKILENPEIQLSVSCFYNYKDEGEDFTANLNDKLILKYKDGKYIGDITLDMHRNDIEEYSCSYSVSSTTGSYTS